MHNFAETSPRYDQQLPKCQQRLNNVKMSLTPTGFQGNPTMKHREIRQNQRLHLQVANTTLTIHINRKHS